MRAQLSEEELALLATQAAVISWKEMKDADKARGYFERVQKINPESEELHAFMRAVESGGVKDTGKARASALMAALGADAGTNGHGEAGGAPPAQPEAPNPGPEEAPGRGQTPPKTRARPQTGAP